MALYRWQDDGLESVEPSKFEDKNVLEGSLQQLLGRHPDALEDGLFTIATEYSLAKLWKTQRAVDLLALDQGNRLVVVELKRDQKAAHAELQAIRYAALVSNMTHDEVIEAHADYLEKKSSHEPGEEKKGGRAYNEEAKKAIQEHLEGAEIETARPRIILASADFSKELTASVLWLRDNSKVEITCIKVTLYDTGKEVLLDTDTIIPLPEAEDYLLKRQEQQFRNLTKQEKERKDRAANFRLPMVGIEGGEILVFDKNHKIRCEVVDPEKATVKNPDEPESPVETLTDYTKRHIETKDGRPYTSVRWALYWRYRGKTLQELRHQHEGKSLRKAER